MVGLGVPCLPLLFPLLSQEAWAGCSFLWASPLPRTPSTGTFRDSMTCAAGSCWSPEPQPSSRDLYEVGAPRSSLATAAAERRVRRYFVASSRRPASPLSS